MTYNTHQEDGFAAGSLRLQETRKLILQLAERYPSVTIIIDALDECNPTTRKDLLAAIEFILRESSCLIKIFVSSRDDQDIVYRLRGYPNLELSSDRNSHDIAKFVESETSLLIENGSLLAFSRIKEKLQQKIVREVVSGASGM
jgi:hypothetical protein